MHDLPLTKYDRSTFYLHGDLTGKGYTDWPVASDVHTTQQRGCEGVPSR